MESNIIIKLHIESTAEGFLYLCDKHNLDNEIELDCELEFSFSPEQKQTMIDPSYDAEMELTSVKCVLGSIDIDAIQNLEEVHENALAAYSEEVYEAQCEAAEFRREEARDRLGEL